MCNMRYSLLPESQILPGHMELYTQTHSLKILYPFHCQRRHYGNHTLHNHRSVMGPYSLNNITSENNCCLDLLHMICQKCKKSFNCTTQVNAVAHYHVQLYKVIVFFVLTCQLIHSSVHIKTNWNAIQIATPRFLYHTKNTEIWDWIFNNVSVQWQT